MNLIDLKLPKKSETQLKKEMTIQPNREEYPYGFRLSFDTEQMQKLPHLKEVEVGEKVGIQGIGEVVEVRKTNRQGEKNRFSVEIQLQKIGIKTSSRREDSLIGAIEKSKKGQLK